MIGTSGGSATYYLHDSAGNLVASNTSSGAHDYYLVDGLGSVVGITNGSGSVVQSYSYDPYGQVESSSGSLGDPWRFAGGYFDGETHFTKFGARYDAQDLGRWTQQDPLPGTAADCRSLDRYVYAQDDPVNLVDASGAQISSACGLAIAGAVVDVGATILLGELAAAAAPATLLLAAAGFTAALVASQSGPTFGFGALGLGIDIFAEAVSVTNPEYGFAANLFGIFASC